jgi:FG-GAP repeat
VKPVQLRSLMTWSLRGALRKWWRPSSRVRRPALWVMSLVVPAFLSVAAVPVETAGSYLAAPTSADGDRFGLSIAWAGGSVVVGAVGTTAPSGAVYVFNKGRFG